MIPGMIEKHSTALSSKYVLYLHFASIGVLPTTRLWHNGCESGSEGIMSAG